MKNYDETLEYALQFSFQAILVYGYLNYNFKEGRLNILSNFNRDAIDRTILVDVLKSKAYFNAVHNIQGYLEDSLVDDNIMSDFLSE